MVHLDSIVARVANVDVTFQIDSNAFGWSEMAWRCAFDCDLAFEDSIFVEDLNAIQPLCRNSSLL